MLLSSRLRLGFPAAGSMTGGSNGGCSLEKSTQEVVAHTYTPSPQPWAGPAALWDGVALRGRLQEAPRLDLPVFSRK